MKEKNSKKRLSSKKKKPKTKPPIIFSYILILNEWKEEDKWTQKAQKDSMARDYLCYVATGKKSAY